MIDWLHTNWKDILAIIGGLVSAVSVVVKLTATKKDDTVWAQVLKILAALSLVNPDGSIVGKGE